MNKTQKEQKLLPEKNPSSSQEMDSVDDINLRDEEIRHSKENNISVQENYPLFNVLITEQGASYVSYVIVNEFYIKKGKLQNVVPFEVIFIIKIIVTSDEEMLSI